MQLEPALTNPKGPGPNSPSEGLACAERAAQAQQSEAVAAAAWRPAAGWRPLAPTGRPLPPRHRGCRMCYPTTCSNCGKPTWYDARYSATALHRFPSQTPLPDEVCHSIPTWCALAGGAADNTSTGVQLGQGLRQMGAPSLPVAWCLVASLFGGKCVPAPPGQPHASRSESWTCWCSALSGTPVEQRCKCKASTQVPAPSAPWPSNHRCTHQTNAPYRTCCSTRCLPLVRLLPWRHLSRSALSLRHVITPRSAVNRRPAASPPHFPHFGAIPASLGDI